MKRLVLILLTMLAFIGCVKEIKRTALDRQFIPEHTTTTSSFMLIPNGQGGFIYFPHMQTIHHADRYEILYEIEYDNGETKQRWKEVTKEQYEQFDEASGNG